MLGRDVLKATRASNRISVFCVKISVRFWTSQLSKWTFIKCLPWSLCFLLGGPCLLILEKSLSHIVHLSEWSAAEGELGPETTESSELEPSSGLSAHDLDGLSDNHMWPEASLFNQRLFSVSSAFDTIGRDIFCLHWLIRRMKDRLLIIQSAHHIETHFNTRP